MFVFLLVAGAGEGRNNGDLLLPSAASPFTLAWYANKCKQFSNFFPPSF